MSLLSRLQAFADRMGIIRVVGHSQSPPAGHEPIQMRTIRLDELSDEVRRERAEAMSVTPGELTLDLDRVIEAAKVVAPPHGWTVERLHEAVAAVSTSGADATHVREAVLKQISADGADMEEVVRDAIARDHAIDAFEQFAHSSFSRRRASRNDELDRLKQQLHDLQLRMGQIENEQTIDTERFTDWCKRKRAREDRWLDALRIFVDEPPVTRDLGD